MTNEEKALEMFPDIPSLVCLCKDVREKLVEIADLKDQQFIECLERLQERFVEYEKHSDWEAIQEIINKFKKK